MDKRPGNESDARRWTFPQAALPKGLTFKTAQEFSEFCLHRGIVASQVNMEKLFVEIDKYIDRADAVLSLEEVRRTPASRR